jgi:Protein of unknown function (DUF1566)
MTGKFTKIGAKGETLADDATEWVAVLDKATALIWTVKETKRLPWEKAQAAVAKLDTAGFKDWRLPTVEELFLLADRTRVSPAIDTAYFPDCKSDWYWTSTPYASSPGVCAWLVYFFNGSAYWYDRDYDGYVRAVRASQS